MLALVAALTLAVPTTSTAYCLTGTMADGTRVRPGSIAHNGLPLGTRVTVTPSPTGRRRFVVRDRIGWGTQLDFWLPSCSAALRWGRRTVHVSVGWPRKRWPRLPGLLGAWPDGDRNEHAAQRRRCTAPRARLLARLQPWDRARRQPARRVAEPSPSARSACRRARHLRGLSALSGVAQIPR